MEYLTLNNGIVLPKIILGSFNVNNKNIMHEMIKTAVLEGETGFDTSPSYGNEQILGDALLNAQIERQDLFISDKIDGLQMFELNGEIEKHVDASLKKLNTTYLDLLLIHWPFEKYISGTWKSMERLYKNRKVLSIGLCNVDVRTFSQFLKNDIEILPHVIQIEISPFRTANEDIRMFQNKGIVVQAYSPLCRMIKEIRESNILLEIAKKYNKSVAQVILRWHLDRNVVPVFTSSKPSRIKENLDIFDFHLETEEIQNINSLNKDYKIFPESFGCPGY